MSYNPASGGGGVTDVSATAPITSSGGATPVISTSIATSRLVGRTSGGTGVMEQISVDATLGLSAGILERAALTGDVTASSGSNSTTIAAAAVTFAKIQNLAAARVMGRGGGGGSGSPEELTLGTAFAMAATTIDFAPTASVDFLQQQALQFTIENRTSDPGSPVAGQIWLRTDL